MDGLMNIANNQETLKTIIILKCPYDVSAHQFQASLEVISP